MMTEFLEYTKCFVAYVDILGFEKIIEEEDSPSNIIPLLHKLFKETSIISGYKRNTTYSRIPKVVPVLVSDTLLLYTKDDSIDSFSQLTGIVADIIYMSIRNGLLFHKKGEIINNHFIRLSFLLRGAISWGDFYAEQESGIYFGPSYNDALHWEKQQEWIGVMLTPKCSNFIRNEKGHENSLVIEYEVPIKEKIDLEDGTYKETYSQLNSLCINWTREFQADQLINPTFYENTNEKYKEKYKNTYDFLCYCKDAK